MRLVFRVSATRFSVDRRRGRKSPFSPVASLFLSLGVFNTLASSCPNILCAPGPTARAEGPSTGPRLFSLPIPPTALSYRYFDRTTVGSRSRSPKTTAAAAENRCSTPYNHIVVLPSPPSPPSPSFALP